MKKKYIWLICLLIVLPTLFILIRLPGSIGVHKVFVGNDFNIDEGVLESVSIKYFGLYKPASSGWSFMGGGSSEYIKKWIDFGEIREVVSEYCEINFNKYVIENGGNAPYRIDCRETPDSSLLVPYPHCPNLYSCPPHCPSMYSCPYHGNYYTQEELINKGYSELPTELNPIIKIRKK